MNREIKILILEDNSADADLILRQLQRSEIRFSSRVVETKEKFEEALDSFSPDIILSDYSLPRFDAVSAFGLLKSKNLAIPFIIVSGTIGEENAISLLKEGVTDFASKNNLLTLPQKVIRGLRDAQETLEKKEILEKLKIQSAALLLANKKLVLQNSQKEKRAIELLNVNKELLAFNFAASHDLQEPLRKIQIFISKITRDETQLSAAGKNNMERIQVAATRMRQLIEDLLSFSRVSITEHKYEINDMSSLIEDVKSELIDIIDQKQAVIKIINLVDANMVVFQFRQLLHNLMSNALKFSRDGVAPCITIETRILNHNDPKLLSAVARPQRNNYWNLSFQDNGIGFEPEFNDLIFGMFQRLHHSQKYSGTGIGLAIVKKIVDNHNGTILAQGVLNKGTTFEIYIPCKKQIKPLSKAVHQNP
jgi:signal transduction histidine kinase